MTQPKVDLTQPVNVDSDTDEAPAEASMEAQDEEEEEEEGEEAVDEVHAYCTCLSMPPCLQPVRKPWQAPEGLDI